MATNQLVYLPQPNSHRRFR